MIQGLFNVIRPMGLLYTCNWGGGGRPCTQEPMIFFPFKYKVKFIHITTQKYYKFLNDIPRKKNVEKTFYYVCFLISYLIQ